ncbi:MAG: GNAT family N-acetyltransferase [Acutalibacter sp.]|jgi:tRNA (guanine37-N1)-methyltransferase
MNQLEQARAYLERKPLEHVDMLEPIRRGMVEVTACREDGVLLYNVPGELYMLASDSLQSAEALCREVESMDLVVAHSREAGEYLKERYGIPKCQPCTQAVYEGKDLLPEDSAFEIRTLGQEFFQIVLETYHSFSDPKYIRNRLDAGVMQGAFREGELAGFIGMHAEGSVGLLEVLPTFRRQGAATALMKHMVNWCLARGWIPFSQIWEGNEASFALHRQLGWTFCQEPLFWVMD